MVAHGSNLSSGEVEAKEGPQTKASLGLNSQTVSQNNTRKQRTVEENEEI